MLDGFQMKDSREMLNIWDLKYNKHNKLLQEQRQQHPASSHLPSASCSIIIYTFVLMFLYCFILTSAENAFASKTATSDKLEESSNDTVHESGINNVNNMLISRENRDVANVPADVPEYDYDDEDDEYQIIKNKSGELFNFMLNLFIVLYLVIFLGICIFFIRFKESRWVQVAAEKSLIGSLKDTCACNIYIGWGAFWQVTLLEEIFWLIK